jgi:hypothetical protein
MAPIYAMLVVLFVEVVDSETRHARAFREPQPLDIHVLVLAAR